MPVSTSQTFAVPSQLPLASRLRWTLVFSRGSARPPPRTVTLRCFPSFPSGETPDTAYVVGTNWADISAVYDPRTKNFVLTSAVDNLVKGASGQAVQIMNLWCGFPETAGLA